MRLIVDEYGAYVKKKSNRFIISSETKTEEYSADKVSQILIVKGTAITTDAIELAMEKEIDIVCLDRTGWPIARIYPSKLGGTTLTRRRQLEAYFSEKGTRLAKEFMRAKIENQAYLLKALGKTRDSLVLKESADKIFNFSLKIDSLKGGIDEIRNTLLGIEGEASRVYFESLKEVLSSQYYAGFRTKRPPEDIFNALLGYGYGMLYSEVEKACIISGLDPYLGFLHADRYGKPSMVLDLIEEFRQPIVDRAMITLLQKKMIDEGDIEREECHVYLNKSGRSKAIEAIITRFKTEITYGGEKILLENVILKQARGIVKFLNNESEGYEPFIHRW
jgi:CRISPR-associated protein Cas1